MHEMIQKQKPIEEKKICIQISVDDQEKKIFKKISHTLNTILPQKSDHTSIGTPSRTNISNLSITVQTKCIPQPLFNRTAYQLILAAFMEPDRLLKRYRRKRSTSEFNITTSDNGLHSLRRSSRAVPHIIYPEILVIVDYDGYRLHGGDNVQVSLRGRLKCVDWILSYFIISDVRFCLRRD